MQIDPLAYILQRKSRQGTKFLVCLQGGIEKPCRKCKVRASHTVSRPTAGEKKHQINNVTIRSTNVYSQTHLHTDIHSNTEEPTDIKLGGK